MNVLETLLSKRWILKNKEKELYYQAKDEVGKVKDFLVDKLGYQVIVNPYLIKVEKIPAQPENWMGIREFKEKEDYIFLCYILMFLEDKEAQEQFVLSALTEYIQAQCKEFQVDWTTYQYRRSLIRVMKFCVQSGMLNVDDGNEESFAKDYTSEVLYENTGVSRYFVKNFTTDISAYSNPQDFQGEEWIDVDMDRGIVRRQRVYRRLLMSMGFVRNEISEEDYIYIRNYRNPVQTDFAKYFDCDLQVYKSGAYLIMGEESRLGRCFPEERTVSDIALLCCGILRKTILDRPSGVPADEQVIMPMEEFDGIIEKCKELYGHGFIKSYRELTTLEFVAEVKNYMEEIELIEINGNQVCISPVTGRIVGAYPKDFQTGGTNDKQ